MNLFFSSKKHEVIATQIQPIKIVHMVTCLSSLNTVVFVVVMVVVVIIVAVIFIIVIMIVIVVVETNSDHTFRRNSSCHSPNKFYNVQAPSVSTDYFTLHPLAKLNTIIISQLAAGTA
jgi:hypothetical protein